MEILHFRYFVAVPKKAQLRQGGAQPAYERTAAFQADCDMEEEPRGFDRNRRKVSLTKAGEDLLPEPRAVLQAFESEMRVARAASSGRSKRLLLPSR